MPKDNKKLPQLQFYKAPKRTLEGTRTLEHTANTASRSYAQISLDASGNISINNSRVKIDLEPPPIQENKENNVEANVGVPGYITNDNPNDNHDLDPPDPAYVEHIEATALPGKTKRVRDPGDESLRNFEPAIDTFLAELLSLDGRGEWTADSCVTCTVGTGEYECLECFGRGLLCQACMVESHKNLYLHRIQKWTKAFFVKTTLKNLGLRIQLGHPPGDKCLNPKSCPKDDFSIIHTNGLHEVGLDYCGCGKSDQRHLTQLLRSRLFPATVVAPKSAATMDVLDLFDFLSYESKMSPFEFYYSLERLSDNTGMNTPNDRYLLVV